MIVDYNLEVLKENTIVQSMHAATTKLDLKRKRTKQLATAITAIAQNF